MSIICKSLSELTANSNKMFIRLLFLAVFLVAVHGQRADLHGDYLGRIVNQVLSRFRYPGDEESPELARKFDSVNDWFKDYLERYNAFVARIPAEPKDKIQGRLIENTKKYAEQLKTQHIDTANNYLAQAAPEGDKYMKTLEMRLNVLARPRFLLNWATPKCGTSNVWWYCGELVD